MSTRCPAWCAYHADDDRFVPADPRLDPALTYHRGWSTLVGHDGEGREVSAGLQRVDDPGAGVVGEEVLQLLDGDTGWVREDLPADFLAELVVAQLRTR
ncbi:hypothetical protein [Nocardioides sp. zg-DK7169]|uniref:hypothetical protein n=1 Tax=Nocardioides sp. zg-DK7169 TaxID=2736600 RepID=UPI00155779F8|nr:hypothetical protein [Nocardioides sp. zg-DK7169]NPC96603.1 hypothetical protein [Nocardioides sp. zg-DK7169]